MDSSKHIRNYDVLQWRWDYSYSSSITQNVEVESISDLLYASNDYNPEQDHVASPEFQAVSEKLEKSIDKVKAALGADIAQELNDSICEVITMMSMNQFKLGYNLALEYLADMSGLPGNTIAERVKAELE